MTRLFLSIISLSLLIYTPYAFGEMSLSFFKCTSTYTGLEQYEETRALLSDNLWKSYVSHKQTFSSHGQKTSAPFISKDKKVSNKKEASSAIKETIINPSSSIKKQELSKDITIKKETQLKINVQLETSKKHSNQVPINSTQKESTSLTRKPSILEPITSIKPSLI